MENNRLVLASRPTDFISSDNFKLEKVQLPKIKSGEFLIKVLYLSVAPVMKFYMLDGAGIEAPL